MRDGEERQRKRGQRNKCGSWLIETGGKRIGLTKI